MITKFKDLFRIESKPDVIPYTQEELDFNLTHSIGKDYFKFKNALDQGANIEKQEYHERGEMSYTTTPIIISIMWNEVEYIIDLINAGAELFDVPYLKEKGTLDNIYDYMKKMLPEKNFKKVMKVILKKYPNFMEEIEIRSTAKNFNL